MTFSPKLAALLLGGTLLPVFAIQAQQPPAAPPTAAAPKSETPKPSDDPIDRIKEEGLNHSQVMKTLSHLTDVIGPRLTASPAMKEANEWTRDTLKGWGLENAHLEAWGPFGKGWTLKRFSAQVIEPQCIPLIAYPKAWTPGLDGTLVGEVVYFDAKTEEDFAKFKGKLHGAIVLTSQPPEVPAHFEPLGVRKTEKDLLELADADDPATKGQRRPRGDQAKAKNGDQAKAKGAPGGRPNFNSPEFRARMELARKRNLFLNEEGAALLIDPSPMGDGGTLFVSAAAVPTTTPQVFPPTPGTKRVSAWDKDAPKIIPQIVASKEHYNRLVRMIEQGAKPKISVDLSVQFHDADLMGYNTVAEIPGTDLKDEVVMLGGHMDSWHSGTGATDNAAGVSTAMEAVRIIKALDLKPRRTIRVALWSGEEQGLLGSRGYVTEHFGKSPQGFGGPASSESEKAESEPAPKPEYEKFSAYFNLDNGTGKIRGVYLQGNESVRPTFRKWLQPFRDMGAATISISNTGGTDHLSFDGIGLPGFQFIQDEIEYETRTHHSNQDLFDRIQEDDMKQASVIMAAFVYNTANLDEKLPRKPQPKPATPPAEPKKAD